MVMHRRPIAIALAASAFYAGVLVTTAHAEMHYVRVTLVTGQQLTITVDVPPGTPVDQVQIPGLPAPVSSIVDLGSTEGTPTPTRDRAAGHRRRPPTPTPTADADAPTPNSGSTGQDRRPARRRRQAKHDRPTEATRPSTANKADRRREHRVADRQGPGRRTPTRPTPGRTDAAARAGRPDVHARRRPARPRSACRTSSSTSSAIPPFLLPIYQAAGTEYGDPLGGAGRDQRDRDRLRPQPATCPPRARAGWMQFMPALVEDLRRRRQQRRPRRTRTTRSTRSSPPRAT